MPTISNLDKTRSCFLRAQNALGGQVGHDLRSLAPVPFYIERGKGSRKWDVDGNEYVDFLMGNAALMLGHAFPAVVEAIQEAVSSGTHFGNDHPLHLEWAEKVQQMIPSAERVRFVNSGTEATLLAIRLARAVTARRKLLRFAGHFHGWHDDVVHGFDRPFDKSGSLGVSGNEQRDVVLAVDSDLDGIEALLRTNEFAGVIVEVTGASWGRAPLPDGLLEMLRRETTASGTTLIFDEVIAGFRFSPGGYQQRIGITPDLTCLAKIVAGGMPGGAVVGREDIMQLLVKTGDPEHDRFGRVCHFGTFNGSPLSAAAGLATLAEIDNGTALADAEQLAVRLRDELNGLLAELDIAGFAYGAASLFHIYFETDQRQLSDASTRDDLVTNDPERLKGMPAALVSRYQELLRLAGIDLMSGTGGALSSSHTEADINWALDAWRETLTTLLDEGHLHQLG